PGEDHEPFETAIERLKDERYGKHDFPDVRLTLADLKELVRRFKTLINGRTGKSFPQDPNEQLWGAIGAVFGSWMNDRAIVYRRKYGIPQDWDRTGGGAGCGMRPRRIYCRRSCGARGTGRKSRARPDRDVSGRFARHDRSRGDSHVARRRVFARGTGCSSNGQSVRMWRDRD